jgi:hypothetical protein
MPASDRRWFPAEWRQSESGLARGGSPPAPWADIPDRKSDLVEGKYELGAPAAKTTVSGKIIDMLAEEPQVTKSV